MATQDRLSRLYFWCYYGFLGVYLVSCKGSTFVGLPGFERLLEWFYWHFIGLSRVLQGLTGFYENFTGVFKDSMGSGDWRWLGARLGVSGFRASGAVKIGV